MTDSEPLPRELLESASRGDSVSLDQLLVRYLPGLRAFVRLRMGEHLRARESCSDLVQSVCREVLQDLDEFDYRSEVAFKQWLYTRALNKILNRDRFYKAEKRNIAREVKAPAETSSPQDRLLLEAYQTVFTPSRDAAAHEEIHRLEQAFEELPENYREVITLSRVVGLSHREIGEQIGKNEGAVRVLLHRALARLGRLMDG
jgi:RNA polymerase sigma-70 factor (ECF subfamily)